jgi:prepilin-type N-terminal cleavage/methylation domain-containing protein
MIQAIFLESPRSFRAGTRGFTLIEILVAISVIAILGALALPAYQSYVAKARSSELALKYDGVRTNMQVQSKAGAISEQCSSVAAAVNAANLHSEYAAMDVTFEAVPGGFTPVMRFCASSVTQGIQGIDVTREAHHLLSRSATIGKGAVIGDAAVSFTVELADGAVACTVFAPTNNRVGLCNTGTPKTTGAGPSAVAIASVATASAPAAASSGVAPQTTAAAAGSAPTPPPVIAGPTIGRVTLMSRITGATVLSANAQQAQGLPVGAQLVGLYLAGSDVNQLAGIAANRLPRTGAAYINVGNSGYQFFDTHGVFASLMPSMTANLQSLPPGQRNAWDGGVAVFADGSVARLTELCTGRTSGERDYAYFSLISGVNANQGMAMIEGTARPGQSVRVSYGGNVVGTVTADAQGRWAMAGAAVLAGNAAGLVVTAPHP